MTIGPSPICMGCSHYWREASELACDAYPGGIPDPILDNVVDHRVPYAGDHGVVFAPLTAAATDYANRRLGELAAVAYPPELAYSPGQKRDTRGRFGSGGGGGGGSAPAPEAPSGGGGSAGSEGSEESAAPAAGDLEPGNHGSPSQKRLDEVGGDLAFVSGISSGGQSVIAPLETAVVLHYEGTEVMRKTDHATNYVNFTDAELGRMKDRTLLHNHPSGRSLSNDDINLAAEADMASIHAYGVRDTPTSREAVRFSMYRPEDGRWQEYRMKLALEVGEKRSKEQFNKRISDAANGEAREAVIAHANQNHSNVVNRYAADLYNAVNRDDPDFQEFGRKAELPPEQQVRYEEGTW